MKMKSESEVAQSCRLLATPWTAAYQAPPSMGLSRQEYWSEVPLPSPKDKLITAKSYVYYIYFSLFFKGHNPRFFTLIILKYFPFSFLNNESMITHLQATWKIQYEVTYSSTIYYN